MPVIVLAKKYSSLEVNLSLEFDDGWVVLTRNNLEDNYQRLNGLGVEPEDLLQYYIDKSIYIDAFPEDVSKEYVVAVKDVEYDNLSNIKDSEVDLFAEEFERAINSDNYDIYNHKSGYKFFWGQSTIQSYNILVYYTVVNKRAYTFSFQFKNNITDADRKEVKKIIDSVDFGGNVLKIDTTEEKNSRSFWGKVLIGVAIGGLVGLFASLIFTKLKKKNSVDETAIENEKKNVYINNMDSMSNDNSNNLNNSGSNNFYG